MRALIRRGRRAVRGAGIKRYVTEIGWPGAAYFASVIAAALLTRHMAPNTLRVLVAALPLPAILWLARAELLRLRRRDELRQRIELEAMTAAFSVSVGGVLMLTFLKLFADVDTGIEVVALLMGVCWFGAQCWARARYRYCWLHAHEEQEE